MTLFETDNELVPAETRQDMVLFRTDDEQVAVKVIFYNESVWLTQEQMAQLFGKAKSTINEHIGNIYREQELENEGTTHKFGNSEFMKKAPNYYNLDVIISVGYRVHSLRGTQFRQWATKRLNMGMTSFTGKRPYLEDALVAKNYLNEEELKAMGQIVSGYLDFAERQADRHEIMTMADWAKHLDTILTATGEQLLIGNGSITHQQAVEKATIEYRKYQARTLSEVEQSFLQTVLELKDVTKK